MHSAALTALALAIALVSALSSVRAKGMDNMFEHVIVDANGSENPHIKTVRLVLSGYVGVS